MAKKPKIAHLDTQEYSIDYLLSRTAEYNPRKIGDPEKAGLKLSMERFGYVQNIIYNKRTETMVSGHQRLIALQEEGYDSIDVIEVDLDLAQEKQLNVVLNSSTITGDFTDGINLILQEILNTDPEFYDLANLDLLSMYSEEIEEEEEEDKIEVDIKNMDLFPYEHYDCLLIVFKKVDDFLFLSSQLGLDEKRIISAPMVENKKVGRTRAIDARKIIELIDKDDFNPDMAIDNDS